MKPKILFILHIPPPVNGAAMVGQFMKESDRINETFDADYINLTTSFNLLKIGKGGFFKIFPLLKIQSRVIQALVRNQYDLCYMTLTASGPGFYKDLLVVCILKLFGKKIIYHFHNKGVKKNSTNALKRSLYHFVFKNAQVIQLSTLLYYDIADYVKKENVFICPNGIPPVNSEISRNHKNVNQPCKFLFLSNMMKEKGVFVLLDSCRILQDRKLSFECHFVGAWSDISKKDFENKVLENGLENRVFAVGPKYGNEKLTYFENSDVFVFPTFYHNESFPLVILEAMQYGLPIISTFEGGISDMVEDGLSGYLVPQCNALELANTMKILIKDPKLRLKMGNLGIKRFNQFFTLDHFETNIIKILKNTTVIEN